MRAVKFITAAFTTSLPAEAPDEIVWMPEGSVEITPSVNGKAQKLKVNLSAEDGPAIAAGLNTDLQARLKDNVRPMIGFDHKPGKAAAIPESFRYQAGQGIMLKVRWSKSGKEAVEGADYGYFSPSFLIHEDGKPAGIPERGEIGSLVNEPAFRSIPLIAAADADPVISPTDKPHMKTVLAALNIDPAHADAESVAAKRVADMVTAAAAHLSIVTAKDQEITDLKVKVAASEAADKTRRTKDGEALHKRAVACGYAAPLDEAKKAKIIKASEDSNDVALEFLTEQIEAAEKAGKVDPTKPLVNAKAKEDGKEKEPTGMDAVEAAFAAELETK